RYVIVGDRVRFKGNDRMWGGGKVTIDRSDFAARGDSMQLNQGAGFAMLVGRPRVEGKGTRPYALTGTRIELGLRDREIRLVKALGQGVATGTDWRLTADTIHLALDRRKLQHAFAWSGGGGGGRGGGGGGEGRGGGGGGGGGRGGRGRWTRLDAREGRVDPQYDRGRLARARHAGRGADRGSRVPPRLLDVEAGFCGGRGLDRG